MNEHEASRTLVKSPPELWAELSDPASLARHLNEFGEIRITRLEPETAVAWEGEHARGTVRLEPSGWGTRVILTAVAAAGAGEPPPEEPLQEDRPAAESAPPPEPEPRPAPPSVRLPPAAGPGRPSSSKSRRKLFGRLLGWLNQPGPAAAEPDTKSDPPAAPRAPAPAPTARAPEPAPAPAPAAGAPEPPVAETVPEPPAPPAEGELPVADATATPDPGSVLTAALDSLGQAHHRPFSRA
jgi:hypothetical protein